MPSPVEQLETAYRTAVDAEGTGFYRYLGDYLYLLTENRRLRHISEGLLKEVGRAVVEYEREDEKLTVAMVEIRSELVTVEPGADDSGADFPGADEPFDPLESEKWREWSWTLANFDGIAEGRSEQVNEPINGDRSRSRALGEILNARIHGLRYPDDPNTKVRDDLDALVQKLNRLRGEQSAAQRRLENVREETGSVGLQKLEEYMSYTTVKGPPPDAPRGSEEHRAWVEGRAMEGISGLAYLREVLRPKEFRGDLSPEAAKRIEGFTFDAREALERLHRPIVRRLREQQRIPRWDDLGRGEKIALGVGVPGLVVAVVGVVATILVAHGG